MEITNKAKEIVAMTSAKWLSDRLGIDKRTVMKKIHGVSEWTIKEGELVSAYSKPLMEIANLDKSFKK